MGKIMVLRELAREVSREEAKEAVVLPVVTIHHKVPLLCIL